MEEAVKSRLMKHKFTPYLLEGIGTFALVFCGTGAIVINELTHGVVTHLGIAISFGAIVMAMIYAIGEKSGAHINPAVTIAFAVGKKFPVKEVGPYVLSQLLGACAASFLLKGLFPSSALLGATLPCGTAVQAFVLEGILTFILMLVILQAGNNSKERGAFAGVVIGSVVLLEALFAGPISGASMNPARSLAPALVSGHLSQLWIYLLAPVAGALAAVGIDQICQC